ncbi:hypothetical protein WOC76_09230 [Methylocystis sp. IM3]|uniref:hypothetical protein n=1 Tax=unclassified Methylocystis TaxID=2625913 RepID=UPI0030FC3D6F
MAALASLSAAAMTPFAPCGGPLKISASLAAAFRRFEEACAEFSAACDARENNCVLAQLACDETDAVIEFANAPCASEAEFVFKLKHLRDYERGTFFDRYFNYWEDGSLLLAIDAFFQSLAL